MSSFKDIPLEVLADASKTTLNFFINYRFLKHYDEASSTRVDICPISKYSLQGLLTYFLVEHA